MSRYIAEQLVLDLRCRRGAHLVAVAALRSRSNSPANVEAARLFQENKAEYYKRVADVVEKSWEFVE